MDTLNLRIRYRPVRFGWCVRENNLEDLRRVLRLTHTLWGGRYNPVIPVTPNTKKTEQLMRAFQVDALYPAADDQQLQEFVGLFPFLPWPEFYKDFFVQGQTGKHLDQVTTKIECEYCGGDFDITSQLRDRDWAYRRSGILGRNDHQEGSIPVALTLQQIDTILHREHIFTTGINLSPITADISACETDFVIVSKGGYENKVQVAIGEAKTRKDITEQDVENLRRVADAFPIDWFDTYIIFAKTSPFTSEEVARCHAAQRPNRGRVILLSPRELEPYFVYEHAEKEFKIRSSAISLKDLAEGTQNIYFEQKRKTACRP